MIKADEYNTTAKKIKAMEAKWGLQQRNLTKSKGEILRGGDINTMIDLIAEGKRKSGWGGAVQGKVSAGQLIRNIMNNLNTEADQITRHCPCNCNYCHCNCNYCSCDCNYCEQCCSSCDSSGDDGM